MPREKGTVFSPLEKEILLELVDKHKFIIENKANNGKILSEKEKARGLITSEYNSRHGVSSRCDGQLKNLWKNMKAKAKTAVATARREQIKTGGGPSTNCLTHVESRVCGILPTQIQSFANPYDADASFHGDREEIAVQDVERSTENTLFSAANETIQMSHTSYPSTSGQSATSPKETASFITRSQSPTEINKKKDSNTACKNGKEVVVHLLNKEHEEKMRLIKIEHDFKMESMKVERKQKEQLFREKMEVIGLKKRKLRKELGTITLAENNECEEEVRRKDNVRSIWNPFK